MAALPRNQYRAIRGILRERECTIAQAIEHWIHCRLVSNASKFLACFYTDMPANLSKKSPRLSTSKIVVLFLGSFKVRPGQEGQRGETIRIE